LIRARAAQRLALSRPAEGIDELALVEAEATAETDWPAAAVAATGTAWVMRELYRHPEASASVTRALNAAGMAGSTELESRALYVRAMIALEVGEADKSTSDIARARELGGSDSEALFGLSVIADTVGETNESIRLVRVVLADPGCPLDVRLKALNNLGSQLMVTDPAAALRALRQAAALAKSEFEHVGAIVTHNMGSAFAYAGDLPAAMMHFQQAEEQIVALGSPAAEHLLGVARVLGDLHLLPEARSAAARAVTQLEGEGGALVRADALLQLAGLARVDGDAATASAALADARRLYETQSRWYGVALADAEAASLAFEQGESTAEWAVRAAAAATRLSVLGKVVESAKARWIAGEIEAVLGRPAVAAEHWSDEIFDRPAADADLARLARCRAAAARHDHDTALRIAESGLAGVDEAAALAQDVDLRFRVGRRRAAFEQAYRQSLASVDPTVALDGMLRRRPPSPVSWSDVPRGVAEDLAAWRECERRLRSGEFTREASAEQIAALRRHAAGLEQRLRRARWSAAATEDRPATIGEAPEETRPCGIEGVVDQLDGRDLLALIHVDSDLIAYTVTGGKVARHAIGPWEDVSTTARRLSGLLSRRSLRMRSDVAATRPEASGPLDLRIDRTRRDLDRWLAPALTAVGDSVVVLADRDLDGVAWGAVHGLFERSVQVAALEAPQSRAVREPRAPQRWKVLLGGGPALGHAGEELESLALVWSTRRPTIEPALTARALLDRFGSDVVHVAAHGELRQDNPQFAALSLADGPVSVGELLDCEVVPRVLYLSSCWLGARPSRSPVPGVAAMLAQRGVHEIVASTTALDDAAAPALATHVHRAVERGASTADGLRGARAEPSLSAGERLSRACVNSFVALR